MACDACAVSYHASCLSLSAGHAAARSVRRCIACRERGLAPGATQEQRDAARVLAVKSMLSELTARRGKAPSFRDALQLVERYEKALGTQGTLENSDLFSEFLRWVAEPTGQPIPEGKRRPGRDDSVGAGRHLSVRTVCANGSALAAARGFPRHSTEESVQYLLDELELDFGDESQGDTPLDHPLFLEIDSIGSSAGLLRFYSGCRLEYTRTRLALYMEYMGGLRVGEAAGGGEGHGLDANSVYLTSSFLEMLLGHSKNSRRLMHVTVSRETASGLDIGEVLSDYLDAWGMPLFPGAIPGSEAEGAQEAAPEHPQYFVCRIDLSGLDAAHIDGALATALDACPETADEATWLLSRARQRREHEKMEARFVNCSGGSEEDARRVRDFMRSHRLSAEAVPGPLLRASRRVGSEVRPTHMPLSCASLGADLKVIFTEAHRLVLERGAASPEDLPGCSVADAKWATHSCRRGGTRRARRTRGTRVTEVMIDLHFRWRVRELRAQMQRHYAGDDPRAERCAVTAGF